MKLVSERFLRNKLQLLNELMKDVFDISLVNENKLKISFPKSQFLMSGIKIKMQVGIFFIH